jgi:predicted dehydrogenase
MRAGAHVWIEKPPAASCAEIADMQKVEKETGKQVAVGFKKMFFPANVKAKEIAYSADFGRLGLVNIQYPQHTPAPAQFEEYFSRKPVEAVAGFLDHICHPASLLVYLCGAPSALYYERAATGAAAATFTYENGVVAHISLAAGTSCNGGMERTLLVSDRDRHVVVDNNISVRYQKNPENLAYGASPSYFSGESAGTVWEPEFSLGQLYNKGIFLLGYYNEVNEFANAVLENRPVGRGGLDDAMTVTRIFEAFAKGPGIKIAL